MSRVRDLFVRPVDRPIEEVIKVDQTDDDVLLSEFAEYVVTPSIRTQLLELLRRYDNTPRQPHEGVGVWVSGFFGSGKSSFAKLAGLALANRSLRGHSAAALLAERADLGGRAPEATVLLRQITERIPTDSVIFDVSTDRGVRGGDQQLTEIVYRLFLAHLGYARDLDLAELEITLEGDGRLPAFEARYRELFGKDWNAAKARVAFALSEASRVLHDLYPATYNAPDSWARTATRRADITPNRLAERCKELMDRRRPGRNLVFVVDEVGQYVARDVQKMLDLQGIVQSLGRVGRGRFWIVVTSQERLGELVAGLDDRRIELSRLMDRFPVQVHLEPTDIADVTAARVLAKLGDAQQLLRSLFEANRGRLTGAVQLTADIRLPDLEAARFIDLYPLLPYQIDLVIQIVSGLRTQGGASRHVGGANRTIIKLAQQLLIHPHTALADQPPGALARLDQVYDLVATNIGSEVRSKIEGVGGQVDHPAAPAVAKAVCLLQFVRSVHRTAENVAAALHEGVAADSRLPEVKAALDEMVRRRVLKLGDDGYRIPTPAEDDWERQRDGLQPSQGSIYRLHGEALEELWHPQPSHALQEVRTFKGALYFNGRVLVDGHIPMHVAFEKSGPAWKEQDERLRTQSQTDRGALFWLGALDENVAAVTAEVYRSTEILNRKERSAQTRDEAALVAEEKQRLARQKADLRRLLRQALLTGRIWFRGNDRSPEQGAAEVPKAAAQVLRAVLPDVYGRFGEAAAKVGKKDLDALLTTENLRALPPVFLHLKLLREQDGQVVFDADQGPLAEVFARLKNRTSYGEAATGRWLEGEFDKEPFGWDFDVVRLLVVSLLRAGRIEATSQAQTIENALSLEARSAFPDNNRFRSASFRPREGLGFEVLAEAADHFEQCFGREIEIELGAIVRALRAELGREEQALRQISAVLAKHELPGRDSLASALEHVEVIVRGREQDAIHDWNASWRELKDAFARARELDAVLTEARVADISRARAVLRVRAPFLRVEPDLDPSVLARVDALTEILARETFFRELGSIDGHATALQAEYDRRFARASEDREAAYRDAVAQLRRSPDWHQLTEPQRHPVEGPLVSRAVPADPSAPIPVLRADLDACPGRLATARADLARLLDGGRVVFVPVSSFFTGGFDDPDALRRALDALREHCESLIGAGKKVHLQ